VDLHLIVDNGSTDGTSDVLRDLRDEGLAIEVTGESQPGFHQVRYLNRFMAAAAEIGADWVLPLDCDEFLGGVDRTGLEEILAATTTPALVPWRTYVPDPGDAPTESNPVRRIRHRLRTEGHQWHKVLVPAPLIARASLRPGSHDVVFAGDDGRRTQLDGKVALCHYPIRSPEQWAAKVAVGNLQHLARGSDRLGLGFHYLDPFRRLVEDWDGFAAAYVEDARRFALPVGTEFEPEVVADAIDYRGGALRHTPAPRPSEPWRTILEYATQLACHVGAVNDAAARSSGEGDPVEKPA